MGRILVMENLSLDGVMQAPGRPDEDTRDGFEQGGWFQQYNDEVLGRFLGRSMGSASGALLLGRRTYEDFFGFWPKQTDGNPFTAALDAATKYVASTTLTEPLPWQNSTLLKGDVAEAVASLKQQPGADIVILGSGALIQSLMRRGTSANSGAALPITMVCACSSTSSMESTISREMCGILLRM